MDVATTDRRIEYLPLEGLKANPANPKTHATPILDGSLGRFGYVESVVLDGRTGMIVSGHGRTETLRLMHERGDHPPDGIRTDAEGRWLVPVTTGWSSRSDAEAQAALVALNRTGEVGGWDDQALLDILGELSGAEGGLLGIGFEPEDVELLRTQLDAINDAEAPPKPALGGVVRPAATGPGTVVVHHGDNLDVLARMEPHSIDAVVTDPPYGIDFMGRAWDDHGSPAAFAAWVQVWATACLRVLKPGGHLIAFGATRTHHRLMQGVEDAGFEIRDCGVWLYRTGFPKSLDVGKAIDKAAGAQREVVAHGENFGAATAAQGKHALGDFAGEWDVTVPATEAAAQWDGWGTALKPSIEPWVLARAPLSEPTVAANVLRWGTGALNIDATRVEMTQDDREKFARGSEARHKMSLERGLDRKPTDVYGVYGITDPSEADEGDRWPANVLTLEPDEDLRYFRLAVGPVADFNKAPASEKPWAGHAADCPATDAEDLLGTSCTCGRAGSSTHMNECADCHATSFHHFADGCQRCGGPLIARDPADLHPTVKPVALMRHLARLVTPPGGTVLDLFAGTGTTGEAAILDGLHAVLIEREASYLPWIEVRTGSRAQEVADDQTL